MNDDKKKRNKPCENCRAHRRKCKVTQGIHCDRCIKMNLPCVFKFTAKPTVIKKNVPVSKKNKMMDQVRLMEQSVAEMEQQLESLSVEMDLEKPTPLIPSEDQWKLTISQNNKGLSFQTSIKSVSDIISFLTKTLSYFSSDDLHSPNFHIDRSKQRIHITNRMLLVETILHGFFREKQDYKKPLKLCYDLDARMQFKVQMIDAYFDCFGLATPMFCSPWFRPIFMADPDSMVASAIAAYITYTNCSHVVNVPPSMTREELAESFRQEARDKLMQVLLEEEPTIFTAATLMLLAQSGLIVLENREARLYLHMAWQMILELRYKYLPIIITTPVTQEVAMAESFRRMFYTIRYLEININLMFDDFTDYSAILFDYGLGLPVILDNEKDDENIHNALDVFRYTVILHVFQMSSRSDNLKFQLFAGSLDSICVLDIAQIENQLFHFWKSLPPHYRVSDAPLEYVQEDRIELIENPYAIYMNHLYYCYWLTLETRLMHTPSSTDLTGANLERFDGERAVLIVSIGCDAVAKLSQALYKKLPCTLELHWLMIASDAMALLQKSQNTRIRERARHNLKTTLFVLEKRIQQQTDDSDCASSTSSSESDYFGEFKKALFTYFENHNPSNTLTS